jgi:hypothetical protein
MTPKDDVSGEFSSTHPALMIEPTAMNCAGETPYTESESNSVHRLSTAIVGRTVAEPPLITPLLLH